MIAEKAIVGLNEGDGVMDVVLGEGVSIEPGAVVEAKKIGDHSTIDVNSKIGAGALVGKWCKVAPLCRVGESEVLEDYTVVFGDGQKGRRIDSVLRDKKEVRDAKIKGKAMEMEVLRGLIPDGSVKWTG
jgi:dynactin-6